MGRGAFEQFTNIISTQLECDNERERSSPIENEDIRRIKQSEVPNTKQSLIANQ